MTWTWLMPKPESYVTTDVRGRKTNNWRTEPILVNLDHVAIIQPAKFVDPRYPGRDPTEGSRLIWHGSPRIEWLVFESPSEIYLSSKK